MTSAIEEAAGGDARQSWGNDAEPGGNKADLPDLLNFVEEASKNARNMIAIILLVCAYTILTIVTTTDVRLITDSHSSPLPIMGSRIPIFQFYVVAPLFLFGLYIYFHLCLQRLWERLAELRPYFPNGAALDQRTYPWLLIGYIHAHVDSPRQRRPSYSRLQVAFAILLGWWTVP